MRIKFALILVVSICISACNKRDQMPDVPTDTEVLVDGQSFSPTENIILKEGNGLLITLSGDEKTITIKTNENIIGTYNILPESGKTSLFATITYKDSDKTFKGTGGSFIISKKEKNLISGYFDAKLIAEDGTSIILEEGSFSEIRTVTLITTESAINDSLLVCYSKMKEYIELIYVFDAVYSNSVTSLSGSWDEIYNHTQSQTPENDKILALWQNAYEMIRMTNLIIESSELMISDENARNSIIGQAKAIRAYLFYNLMYWFGEIPLENEISDTLLPRNTCIEVFSQIKDDATTAQNLLPQSWEEAGDLRIPKAFMSGLIARISLTDFQLPGSSTTPYPVNYNDVISSLIQIINSGKYSLSNQTDRFTESDPEIIWGFEKTGNNEFNTVYSKGPFVPVLRLTEVLLIMAEAHYRSGNLNEAVSYINQLIIRNGNQTVSSVTSDQIFQHWVTEISFEGSSFITARRFDKARSLVNNRFDRLLLPIPLSVIIINPYLTQNIGY